MIYSSLQQSIMRDTFRALGVTNLRDAAQDEVYRICIKDQTTLYFLSCTGDLLDIAAEVGELVDPDAALLLDLFACVKPPVCLAVDRETRMLTATIRQNCVGLDGYRVSALAQELVKAVECTRSVLGYSVTSDLPSDAREQSDSGDDLRFDLQPRFKI